MAKPKPEAEPEYHDIDTAPKNQPIDVSEDGEHWTAAYWRATSYMDFKTRKWERTGFWCIFGTQNARLTFEPLVWRPMVFRAA